MERGNILLVHPCGFSADGRIGVPVDGHTRKVLDNILLSCEEYENAPVYESLPQQPDSLLPFHNVYLAFYTASQAVALLLQFGIAYAITSDRRWGDKAAHWLKAVCGWDISLLSFYAAARLMHSMVAAAGWLQDMMSDAELERVYSALAGLCRHNEKEAFRICHIKETGGHPNLYTGGFGIAALALREMGCEPLADKWLGWVMHKYKTDLFPNDGAPDGTYQPDGNWSIEYAMRYKLMFLDAWRQATGQDLVAEHYDEVTRQIPYLRYAYMGDGRTTEKKRYPGDETMLGSYQINAYSALYLRYAQITKDPYLQWIGMTNPAPGKLYESGAKIKGGPRFIYASGFLDYLWYDPSVKPCFSPPAQLSKLFSDGELAVLRSGFGNGLTLAYQGRRGNVIYNMPNLTANLNGTSFFVEAPEKNSLPTAESNCPASGGGDMERKGVIKNLRSSPTGDVLDIEGFLTRQRITFTRQPSPRADIHLQGLRHSARQVALSDSEGGYVRLRGEGYLQYARQRNLSLSEGMLEMTFRLSAQPSAKHGKPSILFSAGQHLHYMFGNSMFFGFLEDGRLGVKFKDREGRWLFAHLSGTLPAVLPGSWHTAWVYWKNLNRPGTTPCCGLMLDGYCAEARLKMPDGKPFVFKPNTSLWVGGGVQMPDSFAQADIRCLRLYRRCRLTGGIPLPAAKDISFEADYANGLDAVFALGNKMNLAGNSLEYRLHVLKTETDGASLEQNCVRIRKDGKTMTVESSGTGARFHLETLPYARTGFAGESFDDEEIPVYQRIKVRPPKGKDELQFTFSLC